ncbi:MAG TPA: amidohydrolase [Saprospiraceae bacterium]|nr:amidohydrolase [Saprospiraceae bacterium]
MYKSLKLLTFGVLLFLASCKEDDKADLIITNANIYAVDTVYTGATAIAIKDRLILQIGSDEDIKLLANEDTKTIDAQGQFIMPGFIEGHGHYSGLGYSLINLNFLTAKSWEDIVASVAKRAQEVKSGDWIIGRGWHQEKWDSIPKQNVYKYPFHYSLSEVSPDNPVILYHASGHSLYANKKAMDLVGISKETANPLGGEIVRNSDGEAIGVFEERAMSLFADKYDAYMASLDQKQLDSIWYEAIRLAEQECLKKGITSFQDAGSKFDELNKYEKLALENKMQVRLWAMARHPAEELEGQVSKYKKVDVGNRFYTCNAIKSEVDGALGAFGAWLLESYSDKPGFKGQNTTDIYDVKKIADMAIANEMQFCVHAIGDRANRVVLDIYEGVMAQHPEKTDLRWRIEHAQHLNPADIPRFAKSKIIASMQGIHCTSDAPFVVKRLGTERAQLGAYAWRSLLDNGVVVANGTDAPVEDVDPIKSFYASVTRKREDTGLTFFTEQKMTRAEAIYSYTLGNAFAAFEDHFKGSIRPGKVADFVILSNDLINCSDEEILQTKVLYTITDGKIRYSKN